MAYDEQLAGRIRAAIGPDPDVTETKMFGGLAFLAGGNRTRRRSRCADVAVSASGQGGLLLRCDRAETATLLGEGVTRFAMRGREMDGWLHVAAEAAPTDAALGRWVGIGLAYARSLPPKG